MSNCLSNVVALVCKYKATTVPDPKMIAFLCWYPLLIVSSFIITEGDGQGLPCPLDPFSYFFADLVEAFNAVTTQMSLCSNMRKVRDNGICFCFPFRALELFKFANFCESTHHFIVERRQSIALVDQLLCFW